MGQKAHFLTIHVFLKWDEHKGFRKCTWGKQFSCGQPCTLKVETYKRRRVTEGQGIHITSLLDSEKNPILSFSGKKQEKRAFIHHAKLKGKRVVFPSFYPYNANKVSTITWKSKHTRLVKQKGLSCPTSWWPISYCTNDPNYAKNFPFISRHSKHKVPHFPSFICAKAV